MKQFKEYINEKLSFRDALYKVSCKIMGLECITQDKYIKELKAFVQEHSNNKCSIIVKTYKQIKSDLNNCLNKNENVPISISPLFIKKYPTAKTTRVPTPQDNSTSGQKQSFNLTAFTNELLNSSTISLKLFSVPFSLAKPCTTFIPEKSS